jgi:hypothetical protein
MEEGTWTCPGCGDEIAGAHSITVCVNLLIRSSGVVFIPSCTPNSGTSYCGKKVLARLDGGANVVATRLKLPQPLRGLTLLRQTLQSLCLQNLIWFTLLGVGLPAYHYPR